MGNTCGYDVFDPSNSDGLDLKKSLASTRPYADLLDQKNLAQSRLKDLELMNRNTAIAGYESLRQSKATLESMRPYADLLDQKNLAQSQLKDLELMNRNTAIAGYESLRQSKATLESMRPYADLLDQKNLAQSRLKDLELMNRNTAIAGYESLRQSKATLESMRPYADLLDQKNLLFSTSKELEVMRKAFSAVTEVAANANQLGSEIVRQIGIEWHSDKQFDTSQSIDSLAPHAAFKVPTEAEDTGHAGIQTEYEECAIEMLALLIEHELPDWLTTNRTILVWRLAIASYNFNVGFERATGQTAELYTPNSWKVIDILEMFSRR